MGDFGVANVKNVYQSNIKLYHKYMFISIGFPGQLWER